MGAAASVKKEEQQEPVPGGFGATTTSDGAGKRQEGANKPAGSEVKDPLLEPPQELLKALEAESGTKSAAGVNGAKEAFAAADKLLQEKIVEPTRRATIYVQTRAKPYIDKLEKESTQLLHTVRETSSQAAEKLSHQIEEAKQSEAYKRTVHTLEEATIKSKAQYRATKRKALEVKHQAEQKLFILGKQADLAFSLQLADTPLVKEYRVEPQYLKHIKVRRREITTVTSGPTDRQHSHVQQAAESAAGGGGSKPMELVVKDKETLQQLTEYKWTLTSADMVTRLKAVYDYELDFCCNTHHQAAQQFAHAARIGKDYEFSFRLGLNFLVPDVAESASDPRWFSRVNDPFYGPYKTQFYDIVDRLFKQEEEKYREQHPKPPKKKPPPRPIALVSSERPTYVVPDVPSSDAEKTDQIGLDKQTLRSEPTIKDSSDQKAVKSQLTEAAAKQDGSTSIHHLPDKELMSSEDGLDKEKSDIANLTPSVLDLPLPPKEMSTKASPPEEGQGNLEALLGEASGTLPQQLQETPGEVDSRKDTEKQ